MRHCIFTIPHGTKDFARKEEKLLVLKRAGIPPAIMESFRVSKEEFLVILESRRATKFASPSVIKSLDNLARVRESQGIHLCGAVFSTPSTLVRVQFLFYVDDAPHNGLYETGEFYNEVTFQRAMNEQCRLGPSRYDQQKRILYEFTPLLERTGTD